MRPIIQILAKNLRLHRESKGITQQVLADLCGVHRNYILDIEHGKRNITLETLEKISMALDIPITRLLEEKYE